MVRTEMQYVMYQRKIELRTRSMSHLLSSVDLVLYCYTNGRTRVPTVLSLASSAASAFASSLGPLRIVRCIVLLHRVVRIHCLCTTAAAALFASFIMLYSCFDLIKILASKMQLTQPILINGSIINHESSMTISRCQTPIVYLESIVNQ